MKRNDKFFYDLFKRLAKNSKPLTLDVGCGTGERTNVLSPLASTIVGVDTSLDSLRKAAEQNIKVVLADAKKLPFRDGLFDAVTSFHLIEHLDDDQKFLDEAFRVLKDGGFLLIATPNRRRLSQIIYKIITRTDENKFPMNPDHKREYTKSDLSKLFRKSNFKEFHIIPSFLGLMCGLFGRDLQIAIKRPKALSDYCSQWVVWARR